MSNSPSLERAKQIERLFDEALDLDADARTAFLDQACDDDALRCEVESLLAAHDNRAGDLRHALERLLLAPQADGPGTSVEPDTDPLVGQALSRYQIQEKLGGGGMGVVYKAHDTKLGRLVALKFLPPHLGFDEEAKARFIHEAKAASALDHANICTIYDIDETEAGQLFIAMAFYAGETLKKKIARGPLPVEEALDYAMQVAEGLSRAHEAGIVHRDVKPANVMVTREGVVKIVDFGLAKVQDVSLTQTGATLGTAAYMSPQQALGQPVDHRTDLWSLGVMLYEMLTGERPFGGDYAQAILYAIRHDEPKPMEALCAEMPEALEEMVQKLLRKDPDERYGQAEEMLEDLRLLQRTVEAIEPGAGPASAPRRSGVLRYGGMVALVLVLIGFGALLLGQWPGPEAPTTAVPSLAVLPLKNYAEDPDEEFFVDSMTEQLIATLTKIEGLRTISHRSVMRFKASYSPLPVIADSLGVDYVVDGSVLQAEGKVRITATLFEGSTEVPLWVDDVEREHRDVMMLQREVTLAMAQAIEIALTPQDEARLAADQKVDPEAHRLYLLGRHLRFLETTESLEQAIEKFEQAIAIDSNFAQAYAGLSIANFVSGTYYGGRSYEEGRSNAIQYAEQALELNANHSEVQNAFGLVKSLIEWDWEGAEQAFRRAVALNPGDWDAHLELGYLLLRTGRYKEGFEEMQRTLELAPLTMRAYIGLAWAYYFDGQVDEAIAVFEEARELHPDCCAERGWLYLRKGMVEEAVAAFEASNSLDAYSLGNLGHAYGAAGRREEALQILEEMMEREAESSSIAEIYTGLGETDRALDLLEQAVEERTVITSIKIHPAYAPLHAEPRFQALLEKMGLE